MLCPPVGGDIVGQFPPVPNPLTTPSLVYWNPATKQYIDVGLGSQFTISGGNLVMTGTSGPFVPLAGGAMTGTSATISNLYKLTGPFGQALQFDNSDGSATLSGNAGLNLSANSSSGMQINSAGSINMYANGGNINISAQYGTTGDVTIEGNHYILDNNGNVTQSGNLTFNNPSGIFTNYGGGQIDMAGNGGIYLQSAGGQQLALDDNNGGIHTDYPNYIDTNDGLGGANFANTPIFQTQYSNPDLGTVYETRIVSSNSQLTLGNTGDNYGQSLLHLCNHSGVNGGQFDTTGSSITVCDFSFQTNVSTSTANVRVEGRYMIYPNSIANPEFQFGNLVQGYNPVLYLALDGSQAASFDGSLRVPGVLNPESGIKGVTTNSSAASGLVGEFISSSVASGSAVALTNATAKTVTSISLTAGDWDVEGNVAFTAAGTTTATAFQCAVSATNNTLPTAPGAGSYGQLGLSVAAGGTEPILPTGKTRVSLASTTTIYLVAQSSFSVSTMSAYGFIGARRVR